MTTMSEQAAAVDRQISAGPQPIPSTKDYVVRAVFPPDHGRPLVSGTVESVGGSRVLAVMERCDPADALRAALPRGLQHFTPAVRLSPAVRASSRAEALAQLAKHQQRVVSAVEACSGCCERRVLLTARPQDDPMVEGERSRVTAKLAQTVTEMARKVKLTPPDLMPVPEGEVRMALSLMVAAEDVAESETALHLAQRLVAPLGMSLTVTPPGPLESFPISTL